MPIRRPLQSLSALVCLFLLFTVPPLEAQPVISTDGIKGLEQVFSEDSGGAVRHRASGYRFPERLGDMPRRKIIVFAPDDVSIDYTLRGGGLGDPWLSLIVYPATHSVDEEARDVEAELLKNLKGRRIDDLAPPPPGFDDGRSRWFKGTVGDREITTAYFIVKRGAWYGFVRGSVPIEAGQSGVTRLVAAIREIDWNPPNLNQNANVKAKDAA